jgi:5-methylcytosine-specific restriction endonuclease McrA
VKNRSSKRAKALAIPKAVKDRVWERDDHCCIWCGSPYANPEAHFIPRSRGGLGIEENVVTLCRLCHDAFDHGSAAMRQEIGNYCREYLKAMYPEWDEKKLIYRKD